ncbi:MAG: hypothetical protein Dasosvirus3_31 [Dasosvirus sp.]|uniref:Uncharacterized protein n=1 Tax=Dasosvirus sp. TaxID=2487764 RepID=A0A3G4ZRD0_9VIRU|nr:MAG: hypothetical protein Dasosvirus3_31 [Dasosvirus sp.]
MGETISRISEKISPSGKDVVVRMQFSVKYIQENENKFPEGTKFHRTPEEKKYFSKKQIMRLEVLTNYLYVDIIPRDYDRYLCAHYREKFIVYYQTDYIFTDTGTSFTTWTVSPFTV